MSVNTKFASIFPSTIGIIAIAIFLFPIHVGALDRIAAEYTNGDLWMKEGPVSATWNQMTGGVVLGEYTLTDDWLTVLDASTDVDDVSVKEPGWNSMWSMVYGGLGFDAAQIATSRATNGDYRLWVLDKSGNLWLKEGAKDTGWWGAPSQPSSGTIQKLYAAGDRVVALMQDGSVPGKQLTPGSYGNPATTQWSLIASNATDVALTPDRLAYVDSTHLVHAKSGPLNASWYTGGPGYVFENAKSVRMAGNNFCVVTTGNDAICKQGDFNATAVFTYQNVRDVQLSADRFGVVTPANSAYIMEGKLVGNAKGWQFIAIGNVQSLQLK